MHRDRNKVAAARALPGVRLLGCEPEWAAVAFYSLPFDGDDEMDGTAPQHL